MPGQGFEPVTRHHAGVITGAAGDDVHAAHLGENPRGLGAEGGLEDGLPAEAPLQGFRNGAGLFKNLFQHVMAVLTALHRIRGEFADLERPFHHLAVGIEDGQAIPGNLRHVAVFEKDETLGHGDERRHIGGDEVLADADPDHQGAAAPRRHQHPGLDIAHHAQGIGAV